MIDHSPTARPEHDMDPRSEAARIHRSSLNYKLRANFRTLQREPPVDGAVRTMIVNQVGQHASELSALHLNLYESLGRKTTDARGKVTPQTLREYFDWRTTRLSTVRAYTSRHPEDFDCAQLPSQSPEAWETEALDRLYRTNAARNHWVPVIEVNGLWYSLGDIHDDLDWPHLVAIGAAPSAVYYQSEITDGNITTGRQHIFNTRPKGAGLHPEAAVAIDYAKNDIRFDRLNTILAP